MLLRGLSDNHKEKALAVFVSTLNADVVSFPVSVWTLAFEMN
jgi:hypothetical protein